LVASESVLSKHCFMGDDYRGGLEFLFYHS